MLVAAVAIVAAGFAFTVELRATESDQYELGPGIIAQCGNVTGILAYGVHTDGTGYPWLGGEGLTTDHAWEASCEKQAVMPALIGFVSTGIFLLAVGFVAGAGVASWHDRRVVPQARAITQKAGIS